MQHLWYSTGQTTYFHHEKYDENDDTANQSQQAKKESLAGALTVHSPISSPLLLPPVTSTASDSAQSTHVIVQHLFAIHPLDLVIPDILPHDVSDSSRNQAEV